LFTRKKPRYKIGTLLRLKNAWPGREQIMVVDYFLKVERSRLYGEPIIEDKYWVYSLMYLGDGGKKVPQTALWLEEMIENKKIEVVAAPN
jgi:hypothetical protein